MRLLSKLTAPLKSSLPPPLEPGAPPRVWIEGVEPTLDDGAFPVKRVLNDTVQVGADIFKDGHDLIAARVLYRMSGATEYQHAPMRFDFDTDRWFASFVVDRIGLWEFTVEAWPDTFGTWLSDLKKRMAAEQDIRAELLEGARFVSRRADFLESDVSLRLRAFARDLADETSDVKARVATAHSNELAELMLGPLEAEELTRVRPWFKLDVDRQAAAFAAWYELFPRSQGTAPGSHGTFRDTERRLSDIAALGFDVIYLPPIHPIGDTHRKGRNNSRVCKPGDVGSPWAIGASTGGHTAIHPDLGTLEDFRRLVRRAEDLGMEIALDFALQCSPDHPWVKQHPDWFHVRVDGTIRYAENPPKKYEDIYPLNFWCSDRQRMWEACRDAILFWVGHGVKTFRVDNPHTKPLAFWKWAIADVRKKHPDVVFLAEAFTRPKRMKALAKLGFSQSYTYFTWKNAKADLTSYMLELAGEMSEYYRPNFFANTPDILHEYLQHGGRPAFRVRLVLAATLSPVYGIYSGYELCENVPVHAGSEEYLDSEKYELRVRDWRAPGNIRDDVARINRIRRENPALQLLSNVEFLHTDSEQVMAYRRWLGDNELIIIVNLDPENVRETMVEVPLARMGLDPSQTFEVTDLLVGISYTWRGSRNYVRLDPKEKVAHIFRVSRA